MIKTKCTNCGLEIIRYPSKLKRAKYAFCNQECKQNWQRKNNKNINQHLKKQITVVCNQCGHSFERTQSQVGITNFCSRNCFAKWRKENWRGENSPGWKGGKATVMCSTCGKSIKIRKSRVINSNEHFCNHQCFSTWKAKQTKEKSPRWDGGKIVVECANCGRQVERIRSEVENRSKKFFCNTKCMGEWHSKNWTRENHPNWKGRIIVQCSYCGKDIEKERWRPKTKYHFCNFQCSGNWQSENLTGDTRYNWKGGHLPYYGPNWNSQKYKARKRDNFACQVCGISEQEHIIKYGRKLHVHHIKPFRQFNYISGQNRNYIDANSLSNLVTACCVCHRILEAS